MTEVSEKPTLQELQFAAYLEENNSLCAEGDPVGSAFCFAFTHPACRGLIGNH
jgi:hypothetical protein